MGCRSGVLDHALSLREVPHLFGGVIGSIDRHEKCKRIGRCAQKRNCSLLRQVLIEKVDLLLIERCGAKG